MSQRQEAARGTKPVKNVSQDCVNDGWFHMDGFIQASVSSGLPTNQYKIP